MELSVEVRDEPFHREANAEHERIESTGTETRPHSAGMPLANGEDDFMKSKVPNRSAFTLVELLVVMGIMALLAAIGLFVYQPFNNRSAVNNGAVLLQSWLNAAKQRALRDQAPRGLRLLLPTIDDAIKDQTDQPNYDLILKCVFLEQDEDIVGGAIFHAAGETDLRKLTITSPPTLPTLGSASSMDDYLEVNGGPLMQIKTASGASIQLERPFPYKLPQSAAATFRITRKPRALGNVATNTGAVSSTSQEILQLPRGACIALKTNATFGNTLSPAAAPIDILFAPDGSVMSPAPNPDRMVFWVSGTRLDANGLHNPMQGQPQLVVVHTRSGLISSHNAALTATPYENIDTD